MDQIIGITAFVILTLLWLGFLAALVFNRGSLDRGWPSFRRLPLVVQLVLALLVLPVVVGLWIWHTSWPTWVRLAWVIGLAWMTVYTFFPRLSLA